VAAVPSPARLGQSRLSGSPKALRAGLASSIATVRLPWFRGSHGPAGPVAPKGRALNRVGLGSAIVCPPVHGGQALADATLAVVRRGPHVAERWTSTALAPRMANGSNALGFTIPETLLATADEVIQ
jgi:hypothetical protein